MLKRISTIYHDIILLTGAIYTTLLSHLDVSAKSINISFSVHVSSWAAVKVMESWYRMMIKPDNVHYIRFPLLLTYWCHVFATECSGKPEHIACKCNDAFMYICVLAKTGLSVNKYGQVACSAPVHYMTQCWLLGPQKHTPQNKFNSQY